MATRNRTALFKQYRNTFLDRSGRKQASGYASGGFDSDSIEMIPKNLFWTRLCEDAERDLDLIREKVPELEKLHKSSLVGFSDEMETEHEIEILTGEISDIFQRCQSTIKQIGHPPKGTVESPNETKLRTNAQIALATPLQELSSKFRKIQQSYLSRLQGTEERNREVLSGNSYLGEDFTDPGFDQHQMSLLADTERIAEEREREIDKIHKSINDLAMIFKEMHMLVLDQGTVLDRIDYNIEKVVTYTEEAVGELVKADKSQKSYRKKLCILFLIVVVVALVLFLVARPKKSSTTPTNPPAGNGTRALDLASFGFFPAEEEAELPHFL